MFCGSVVFVVGEKKKKKKKKKKQKVNVSAKQNIHRVGVVVVD